MSFSGKIKEKVKEGKYFMSQHAIIESAKDMVDDEDIEEAISNGQLLEDYPDDRRGHSKEFISKITFLSFPDSIGESRKGLDARLRPAGMTNKVIACMLTNELL